MRPLAGLCEADTDPENAESALEDIFAGESSSSSTRSPRRRRYFIVFLFTHRSAWGGKAWAVRGFARAPATPAPSVRYVAPVGGQGGAG